MINERLTEFQSFLRSRHLAAEKHIPFYAQWASQFLAFSNVSHLASFELKSRAFLDQLHHKDHLQDWQIRQAENAITLYAHHFLKGHLSDIEQPKEINTFQLKDIFARMQEAMRVKHYSYRTERSYIDWGRRFFTYMTNVRGVSLEKHSLKKEDVRDYLAYLALQQKVAASTQNQAFNALLFLFQNIFHVDMSLLGKTVRAKRGPKIPVVLTVSEIEKLFQHLNGTQRLITQLLYGGGLRLMELARLRVKDVDFEAKTLVVRNGKGGQDRTTILPELVKSDLLSHLERVKVLHQKDLEGGFGEVYLPDALARKYPNAGKKWIWQYVFPSARLSVDPRSGKVRRHHVTGKAIQLAVTNAVKKAEIPKHATVHTLRHSFATHLLMNGVNIREVQDLLGHKNVETTMVYTHVLRDMSNAPKSPLDEIYL